MHGFTLTPIGGVSVPAKLLPDHQGPAGASLASQSYGLEEWALCIAFLPAAGPPERGRPANRSGNFQSWRRCQNTKPPPAIRLAARGVAGRCASGIPLSLPASTSPRGTGSCRCATAAIGQRRSTTEPRRSPVCLAKRLCVLRE